MASLAAAPAKNKFNRKRSSLHIDMTPMVDLAFLLLTFFIMTTTLMKRSGMEIKQPISDTQDLSTEVQAEKVLNLVLGKNNQVYWYMGLPGSETNTIDFSSSGVRKLLTQKNAEIKNLYVFIKASDQSRYQNMVDALDEIMITNTVNYSLLELKPEDKALIHYVIP
jgi:biopolymer transport protein ExbD